VADGVGVLDDHLVHPGERLREQHGALEEAQVAPVLGQGEGHVGHRLCGRRRRGDESSFTEEPRNIDDCTTRLRKETLSHH